MVFGIHSPRAGKGQGCTPVLLFLGGHYVHSLNAELSNADTLQLFHYKLDAAITTLERQYGMHFFVYNIIIEMLIISLYYY